MQPPKYRKIMRALKRAGFTKDHDTGSHSQWTHPDSPGLVTTKNKPAESPPQDTWRSIRQQIDAMGLLEAFDRHL